MEKIIKTDAQWHSELSSLEYQVTRCGATERPFTGQYWNHHEHGVYSCLCCGAPLFLSAAKFDSGCGWPSYFAALNPTGVPASAPAGVREMRDTSHGMIRTEVICNGCDAHLGHLFKDGPSPTGLRYCINSAALRFDPQ